MKKILLCLMLVASLVLGLLISSKNSAPKLQAEVISNINADSLETMKYQVFGFNDYDVVKVSTAEELKNAMGGTGYRLIEVESDLTVGEAQTAYYIKTNGYRLVNLQGHTLYSVQPGMIKVEMGVLGLFNGSIKCITSQIANVSSGHMINVQHANLITDMVEIAGNYSAVQLYDSNAILSGTFKHDSMNNGYSICLAGKVRLALDGAILKAKIAPFGYVETGSLEATEMSADSVINYCNASAEQYEYGLLKDTGKINTLKNVQHFYGGRVKLGQMLPSSTYSFELHDVAKDEETLLDGLKYTLNTEYEKYVPNILNANLSFKLNNISYSDAASAVIAGGKVSYSYKVKSGDKATTVDSFAEVPSGTLSYLSIDVQPAKNSYYFIVEKSLSTLSDSLVVEGKNILDVPVEIGERLVIKTDYCMDNVLFANDHPEYFAENVSFEWEVTNLTTGEKTTIKNGYPSIRLSKDQLGRYKVTAIIHSSNGYNKVSQTITNDVFFETTPTIRGTLKITPLPGNYNEGITEYTLLNGEQKSFGSNVNELQITDGATKVYQWYYSSSYLASDRTPVPNAKKATYTLTASDNNKYLCLGVKARYMSVEGYYMESEEVFSQNIQIHVQDESKFDVSVDAVGSNYARIEIAKSVHIELVATLTGDTSSYDTFAYQWCYQGDDEVLRYFVDNDAVSGAHTENFTFSTNVLGEYKIICLVSAKKGSITKAVYSYPITIVVRNAGVPTIQNQPHVNKANIVETDSFQIQGLGFISPDGYDGGTCTVKWYRSTDSIGPNDSADPASLNYVSITGDEATNTIYTCSVSDNPGVGLWYYYAVVTNHINGYTASDQSQYVAVSISDHAKVFYAGIETPMVDEVTCYVGETVELFFDYYLHAEVANYQNFWHLNSIVCDAFSQGTNLAEEATLIETSADGKTKIYRVKVKVNTSVAGTYSYSAIYSAAQTESPFDGSSASGYNGDAGLTTIVTVLPTDSLDEMYSCTQANDAQLVGSINIGNLDYYQTGTLGNALANGSVKAWVDGSKVSLNTTVANYSNFKGYELFVETKSGTFVKAAESNSANNLPVFNFAAFNQALDSEDKYEDNYTGFINAFIRVKYAYVTEMNDDTIGGMVEIGIIVLEDGVYDSQIFRLNVIANCSHNSGSTAVCHHDTMTMDIICDACSQVVQTVNLNLETVEEVPATCTTPGVLKHLECPICHALFDLEKNPATAQGLTIAKDHEYIFHAAKEASCLDEGNIDYYECKDCHEIFVKHEDQYIKSSLEKVILYASHTEGKEWKHNSEGHFHTCSVCGNVLGEVYAHEDKDADDICDVCGRDLTIQAANIDVNVSGGTFGDGSTSVTILEGGIVSVVASEVEGKDFDGWYINGVKVSNDLEARLQINESCTIEARYTDKQAPTNPTEPKSKGLSAGAIVGIVIGGIVILGGAGFAVFYFLKKKKQ